MNLLLKIAWRNILRHKGKSLVIGVILFIGALLMTLGNGVITGMDAGIRKNVVNTFMGDIVLISDKQKSDNIFFNMMGTSIEPVTTYKEIKEVLKSQGYIDRFLPAGENTVMILKEDENSPSFAYLMGVDFNQYQKMFPDNMKPIEGRLLNPAEKNSILVPTHIRNEHIYTAMDIWVIPEGGKIVKENLTKEASENMQSLVVSTSIVMMGLSSGSNTSTDIRFGVKGIVKYNALNSIFGHFCVTDIESYRNCLGYFSAGDQAVEVPKEEQKLLNMGSGDIDSMFGSEQIIVPNAHNKAVELKQKPQSGQTKDLGIEDGVYNLVFIKLKNGVSYSYALGMLNKALTAAEYRRESRFLEQGRRAYRLNDASYKGSSFHVRHAALLRGDNNNSKHAHHGGSRTDFRDRHDEGCRGEEIFYRGHVLWRDSRAFRCFRRSRYNHGYTNSETDPSF